MTGSFDICFNWLGNTGYDNSEHWCLKGKVKLDSSKKSYIWPLSLGDYPVENH